MVGSVTGTLPSCGLYRTTRSLPGHEEEVSASMLVYFHNHSDTGLPRVILPTHMVCNRWHFHGEGIRFRALSWAESLVRLPEQGLYVLGAEFRFKGGAWPKSTLVQMGYTRKGEPMLFIAQRLARSRDNHLLFSDRGVRIPDKWFSSLQGPLTIYTDPGDGSSKDPEHEPRNPSNESGLQ